MKLHQLKPKSGIRFQLDGAVYTFIKCDGMYAQCIAESDNDLVFISCTAEVTQL